MSPLNILFTEDYLGSYPSILNALLTLDSNNVNTNLFLFRYKTKFPRLPKFKNVSVNYFTRNSVINRHYELNFKNKNNPLILFDKFFKKFEIGIYFKIKESFICFPKPAISVNKLLFALYIVS